MTIGRNRRESAAPLEGIKVLEMGNFLLGPACGAILGDWGADVIKLETPKGGDPMRASVVRWTGAEGGINHPFEMVGRNKRSVAVDLKQAEGRAIAQRLAGSVDVFLSNFRAGALKRMGMDYETLAGVNPRLIYAHASGYGERGEERERAGYDFGAFWARCGIMATLGEPGEVPPQQLHGLGDMSGSLSLAGAIALALFVRERTGIGQQVNLSLLGHGVWTGARNVQAALSTGEDAPRQSRKQVANPLWNSYRSGDGKWFQLVCLESYRYWPGLCAAIDRHGLEHQPEFASHDSRRENSAKLIALLDEVFGGRPREEWGRRFDEQDVLWAPVQSYAEVATDPQVLANGYIAEVPHAVHGSIKLVMSPVQLSRTPPRIRATAPGLGQHTEEVLLDVGYSRDDLAGLREKGVIT